MKFPVLFELPAAQGLHDYDLIPGVERLRKFAHLLAIEENADVAPDLVLLVDHAETNPGVSLVEFDEDGGQRRAAHVDFTLVGVRTQCAGYQYFHASKESLTAKDAKDAREIQENLQLRGRSPSTLIDILHPKGEIKSVMYES